ncbi:tectonic-1-like [Pararge aegeria]|uniref:tectonic-1-like n=1 Tax=Pararge aegeria TaxID=116150 RepID=UPI0019D29B6A|nr:tectonic-1-like [Pararge aegeria]
MHYFTALRIIKSKSRYKACDINCCCDNDCSDQDKSVLKHCEDSEQECEIPNIDYLHMCSSQLTCNKQLQSDVFGYLFCIGKANLPEKGKPSKTTLYSLDPNNRLKWHVTKKKSKNIKFTKNLYSIGQPIWMVTNDSIDSLELPITVTNEYCNGYKAIEFLRNDYVKCYVKLKDLHMLDVIKSFVRAKVVSPIEITLNSTKMDCTTLHCINLTLLSCDEHKCIKYNKELHEPRCSESHCNNIAVRIEYEFYCNVSLIKRVIVKFHVRTISMAQEFVLQEIAVNFYLGNYSIENIVKFSGNPGYIRGLPIIISLSESNHTAKFFNSSVARSNYLLMPYNRDGRCVVTNLTHNIVMFGHNKRLKCRAYFRQNFTTYNGTEICQKIQARIDELYGLRSNILIAPYGNPQDVADKNWVRLETFNKSNIYGEYHPKDSKLLCYNLITRIAFIIAFADTNDANKEVNKIISARVDSTTMNKTFSIDDLSTVITIDANFIDVSKPTFHEYIGIHFDFKLPKDFFFPLASNKCQIIYRNITHLEANSKLF